jgi:hypothetical protein
MFMEEIFTSHLLEAQFASRPSSVDLAPVADATRFWIESHFPGVVFIQGYRCTNTAYHNANVWDLVHRRRIKADL